MIPYGWARAPDVEWYDVYDCPVCGAQTLLEGIVVRRFFMLFLIPVPLWRDWYFRCHACHTTWKVEKQAWRERSRLAFTVEQVAREARISAEAKRSNLPFHLGAWVHEFEHKGWKFVNNTDDTADFWRERGASVERLRIVVNADGHLIKQEEWTE